MRTHVLERLTRSTRLGLSILGGAAIAAATLAGCDDSTDGTGGSGTGGDASSSSSKSTTGSKMSTTSTASNMTTTSSGMDVCGDGTVANGEGCDDGNTTAGDGCDAGCVVEMGWECNGEPSNCAEDCGDGIRVGAETCDDGNNVADDGCSLICTVEKGFTCDMANPNVCASSCGDGVIASDEECDDMNTTTLDGCDASCDVEAGWMCANEPSACMVTGCGDGFMVGMEGCDDGNQNDDDGCSAGCVEEPGFICTGTAPTVCTPDCGDGAVVMGETCDDSNTTAGDCCSAMCAVEPGCEIEVNNATGMANDYAAIAINQVLHGFVDPLGDVDYFVFTVPAGQTYDFRATTSGGVLGAVCADDGIDGVDSEITLTNSMGMTIATNDDFGGAYCSQVTAVGLTAGTYFLEVRASDIADAASETFDYDLTTSFAAAVCGNGFLGTGEGCDDGNTMPGDGCSATCQVECPGLAETEMNGTAATANGPLNPNVGNCAAITPIADRDYFAVTLGAYSDISFETFDGSGTTCALIDTVIRFYGTNGTTELVSDDQSGVDSCSKLDGATVPAMRHLAPGTYYVAVEDYLNNGTIPSYQLKYTINATCGNGTLEGSEQCDGTPGCGSDCLIIPVCGNGTIDAGEQCDQGSGNVTPGDGCSASCQVEMGFACMGTPSVCMPAGPGVNCSTPIVASNGFTFAGSNIGQYANDASFAGSGCNNGQASARPDLVFQIALTTGQKLKVTNFGNMDVTFNLTQPCGAATCLANYDGAPGVGSGEQTTGLQYTATSAGTYFVTIEPYFTSFTAAETYDIRFEVSQCGNGITESGEICDNGNTMSGDGCNATCSAVEAGFACDLSAPGNCHSTTMCMPGDLACFLGSCGTGTFVTASAAGVPAMIPDFVPAGGVTLTIPIAAAGNVTKMAMKHSITTPYVGDIDLFLTGPNGGGEREILSDNGSTGDNFTNTVLRDGVPNAITGIGTGGNYTAVFRPELPFSFFSGQPAAGNWTLRVADDGNGDLGTITDWTLGFCVQ